MKKTKLLIACLIAVSFAACGSTGGGHDGGGNTSIDPNGTKDSVQMENLEKAKEIIITMNSNDETGKEISDSEEFILKEDKEIKLDGDLENNGKDQVGIKVNGGEVTNKGTVELNGNGNSNNYKIGISVSKGGEAVNDEKGTIILNGIRQKGMVAEDDGKVTNNGKINFGKANDQSGQADDGDDSDFSDVEIGAAPPVEKAETEYNNDIFRTVQIGMSVFNGGIAINNGRIESHNGIIVPIVDDEYTGTRSNAISMYAENGGKIINENLITGDLDGMIAYGVKTKAINNGIIRDLTPRYDYIKESDGTTYTVKSIDGTGMFAENGGYITNGLNGKIVGEMENGMEINGGGKAINLGIISLTGREYENISSRDPEHPTIGSPIIGMSADDGGVLENRREITIEKTAESTGMYVELEENNKGKAINYGTINLNGDNQTGMHVYVEENNKGKAKATNKGTINLNGKNDIGMKASGEGAIIINAEKGEIHLSGDQTGTYSDSRENIAMKAENGGKIINRGKITFGK